MNELKKLNNTFLVLEVETGLAVDEIVGALVSISVLASQASEPPPDVKLRAVALAGAVAWARCLMHADFDSRIPDEEKQCARTALLLGKEVGISIAMHGLEHVLEWYGKLWGQDGDTMAGALARVASRPDSKDLLALMMRRIKAQIGASAAAIRAEQGGNDAA